MKRYIRDRFKYFIAPFVIGTIAMYLHSEIIVASLLVGCLMAVIMGNGFYYMLHEKNNWIQSTIRIIKYLVGIVVVSIIINIIIY